MDEQGYHDIRQSLIDWFDATRRDLPWRRRRAVYTTWISEVMLQQTRVDQVTPYFHRFVEMFPDVGALAAADIDDVMKAWEGLGYYARARNLHRAAAIVAEDGFPQDRDGWRQLPGVGRYTSAAVASIAHDEPVAAVDGNVARVISRLFAVESFKGTAQFDDHVLRMAEELLLRDRPGAFNEAMMDLGATVCTPTTPDCPACPLASACVAFARDEVSRFPQRTPRKPVPLFDEIVAVVHDQAGRVFVRRRPDRGLLGGLWEFPGIRLEHDDGVSEDGAGLLTGHLREEYGIDMTVGRHLATVRHAYSHFRVRISAFKCLALRDRGQCDDRQCDDRQCDDRQCDDRQCDDRQCDDGRRDEVQGGRPEAQWLGPAGMARIAMPRAHRKLIASFR